MKYIRNRRAITIGLGLRKRPNAGFRHVLHLGQVTRTAAKYMRLLCPTLLRLISQVQITILGT